ncbi:hypothetical protein [Bradyrhizobium tunisiense]|uniref:hypothetical protein n=1 Tax=Bradyrhizobium tunisiense TaxID=3278709 RepID=UPI0035D5E925
MKKTRRKIDAALKAKIALETLREQSTVTDLAYRRQVQVDQIYFGKDERAGPPSVASVRSRASIDPPAMLTAEHCVIERISAAAAGQ